MLFPLRQGQRFRTYVSIKSVGHSPGGKDSSDLKKKKMKFLSVQLNPLPLCTSPELCENKILRICSISYLVARLFACLS
ncbi:mCG147937 [Mus musculus]|nr:mCG147937 [Mus musculus]